MVVTSQVRAPSLGQARQQEAFLAEIKKSVAIGARCTGVVVPIGALQLDGQVPRTQRPRAAWCCGMAV